MTVNQVAKRRVGDISTVAACFARHGGVAALREGEELHPISDDEEPARKIPVRVGMSVNQVAKRRMGDISTVAACFALRGGVAATTLLVREAA